MKKRMFLKGNWKKWVAAALTLTLVSGTGLPVQAVPDKVSAAGSDKVVFTDFEEDVFTGNGQGNRITQKGEEGGKFVTEGNQALKYAKHESDNGVWDLRIKPVSGSAIDISGMDKVMVDVLDTQGNNGIEFQFVDANGNMSDTKWSGNAVKDTWTTIELDISNLDFKSADKTQISQVKLYEWNKGDYYIDNIRFSNAAGTEIRGFQDFEQCLFINDAVNNQIVSKEKRSGSNSVEYKKGGNLEIETANKQGVDATGKEFLVLWVKDTKGSNSFALKLIDGNGTEEEHWTNDIARDGVEGVAILNKWKEIIVPMSKFTNIDKSKIKKLAIWEWNEGTFYIDDIYFTNTIPPKAPTANRESGTFTGSLELTLTSGEVAGDVYYTTNGDVPTTSSTIYTAPIIIDKTSTIKAITVVNGESSRILQRDFTLVDASLEANRYLQDFEGNQVVAQNGTVTNEDVYKGVKGGKYTVTASVDPTEANSFYVEGSTPIDISKYTYFVFWLKDTQGENTVKIQLIDVNGNKTSLNWFNTLTGKGKAAKNVWTEYAVKISDLVGGASIDLTKIKGIRIGEWNSGTYFIDDIYVTNTLMPKAPTSNINSGTYENAQNVTLSAEAGYDIYYTTDGSEPTKASNLYSGTISITGDTVLKAVAIRQSDGQSSQVVTYSYRIKPLPTSGYVSFHTFDADMSQVSHAQGAEIMQTTAEKYHGNSGLMYKMTTLSGEPKQSIRTITIKPEQGNSVDARLSKYLVFYVKDMQGCNNTRMFIKDINGNEAAVWTDVSTVYGEWSQYFVDLSKLPNNSGIDLSSIAEVTFGFWNSGTYYIDEMYFSDTLYGNVPGSSNVITPVANTVLTSVPAGSYDVFVPVELIGEEGPVIHYTTDGTTPTNQSAVYNRAIYLEKNTTIKAIAIKNGVESPVFSFDYKILPAKVFATYGKAGTYDTPVIVALRSSKDNTPIFYTLDGSVPGVTNGTLYTSPFRIEQTSTLKAIAYSGTPANQYKDGEVSEVSELQYTILSSNTSVRKPISSLLEGTYGDTKTITLSTKTAGASIYYTTNGSTPTTTSALYTQGIVVAANTVIKAIAVKGNEISEVAAFSYVINRTPSNFLKTDGKLIRNQFGTGDAVTLRGTNVGGWLITENWQSPVDAKDLRTILETFTSRFGKDKAWELVNHLQNNWWTEKDFDLVKAEGINILRLPMSYFEMMNEDGSLKTTAFARMDWFIQEAKKRDIYVMIDMHGAVGSQNGKDHSGDTTIADIGNFYGNEENIQKTIYLWEAIAKRYKDEPMVCGYDLLNEPSATGIVQYEVYDRIYRAIRAIDTNHIIYLQAIWNPVDLPDPSLYGWENISYQYHFYQWDNINDLDSQLKFVQSKIDMVNARNFNVPTFVGEFTFFANEESWKQGLALYEKAGWNWTTWTFKVSDGGEGSSWGIYTGKSNPVLVGTDTEAQIKEKWSQVTTNEYFTRNNRFADVIKGYFAKNTEVLVKYQPEAPNPNPGTTPVTPTPTPSDTAVTENKETKDGIIVLSIKEKAGEGSLLVDINIPANDILKAYKDGEDKEITIPISSSTVVKKMEDEKISKVNVTIKVPRSIQNHKNIHVGNLQLSKELLEAAKAYNKQLVITVVDEAGIPSYSWTFEGKDLAKSGKEITDSNLALNLYKAGQDTLISKLMASKMKKELKNSFVINLSGKGNLPSQASIRINVKEFAANGKKVYPYIYNPATNKLETFPYSSNYKVDKDGFISLDILQYGEYVFLPKKAPNALISSLDSRIIIPSEKKTLSLDGRKDFVIEIQLPETLERIASKTDKTSSSKKGWVVVSFETSNKKVVTVSKAGKVKAKGKGTAWVTVKTELYNGKVKIVKTQITVK